MKLQLAELTLRKFKETDCTRLAELCNNKRVWDNLRDYIPHPYTIDDARSYILSCQQEETQTIFAVEYNGELVGSIGLILESDVYRISAEIGYWIGEPYWGLEIATKAVCLVTEYGFNHLGLKRIFSKVFGFNKASQRVLEKAGYSKDAILKKAAIKNNTIIDIHLYSILPK